MINGTESLAINPSAPFHRCFARVFVAAIFGITSLLGGTAPSRAEESSDNPVVVELFTSQGCYSCPPAEAHLRDLADRDDIIALEFHVDYWDYIGWKDPFASPAFTQRQRDYVRRIGGRYAYTPQMVIGGRADEIGSRRAAVAARIDAISMHQKAEGGPPTIDLTREGDTLTLRLDGDAAGQRYDILVVGFDDRHETDVPRGENAGKQLINTHTVRRIRTIGEWRGEPIMKKLSLDELGGDGGCAILVQAPDTGPILAARMIKY